MSLKAFEIASPRLAEAYLCHVDAYRSDDGTLPELMALKLEHTAYVIANAAEIAQGEGFSPEARQASVDAALLHDTGRYEQLRRYNTFRDAQSVDHAVLSHRIVVENGWTESRAILDAVLFHNRRDLPRDMDGLTSLVARTVRDADKLDIFRVLEVQIEKSDWRGENSAFWGLPVSAPPNPAVVDRIVASEAVDYREIKSLADFVLVQVGWMVCGLEFSTSRRLCLKRGHLQFRRSFLKRIADHCAIEKVCALAEEKLGREFDA